MKGRLRDYGIWKTHVLSCLLDNLCRNNRIGADQGRARFALLRIRPATGSGTGSAPLVER